jgi:hypothetical protein
VFGDINPVIGSVAGLLFVSILITGLLYAARMTRKRGSKAEYDWDEYSSELEDDEDEYEYDEEVPETTSSHGSGAQAGAATTVVATATTAEEEETDWVRGSDGYWWYHDKVADEWWYKDSEGNIVRHD